MEIKFVGRLKTPRRVEKKGVRGRPHKSAVTDFGRFLREESQYLYGSQGAAGPCRRICPKTGAVIEIVERKRRG